MKLVGKRLKLLANHFHWGIFPGICVTLHSHSFNFYCFLYDYLLLYRIQKDDKVRESFVLSKFFEI
jgi:hypothetical protein